MVNLIASVLPYKVLAAQILFIIFFLTLLSRNSWGKGTSHFLGKHAILLGFFVTLAAVLGSLFYSQIIGYEPCELCWWQRILIYPQVILFLTALKYKDRNVFRYAWRLSILAAIIALYQIYAQAGGVSILPCTAIGGACSKVYINAFGYITIPVMSLTISLYVLLLAWANKLYENRNA